MAASILLDTSFRILTRAFLDHGIIIWEPSLVEPFQNAPLVTPPEGFIEKNFKSNKELLKDFLERFEDYPEIFSEELIVKLLGGIRERNVGMYSKFHDLATWAHGYDSPEAERFAHM
jgi:RNA-dependent RNA polymerase